MVNRPVRFGRGAAAIAALTVSASVILAAGAPQTGASGAAGNAANGRALYTSTKCDTCHGVEGAGAAGAPRIAGTRLQLPAFMAYVRKPAETMPAQSAQAVPDQHLADIYAFLRAANPAAVPRPVGRAEEGTALYNKVGCYECHANDAQGGANGPRIGPNPIPFQRFVAYVRNPAGDMPPFTAKVISDQDLASIYAFLQAQPQPPPVNSIPLLAP